MNLKQYITEKNILYLLIGILLLSTFLDIYTAFTSPIFEIGETNPIYVLTGSKGPLLLLTVVFTIWIIRSLQTSISLFKLFLFSLVLIYMTFGHFVGVYGNTITTNDYKENPEEVKAALENYDAQDKFVSYSMVIGMFLLLPYTLSFIAFYITMYFHNQRKPERERITDEIYKLSKRLKER